jgi:uncharacterized protein HemY
MVTPTQRLRERWNRQRAQRQHDKAYVARLQAACERGDADGVRAVLNELPDEEVRDAALVLAALGGLLDEGDKGEGGSGSLF